MDSTALRKSFIGGYNKKSVHALLDYLASIIASSMMGIMITWVERGKKESEEELKGVILQSFKAMKFIGLT